MSATDDRATGRWLDLTGGGDDMTPLPRQFVPSSDPRFPTGTSVPLIPPLGSAAGRTPQTTPGFEPGDSVRGTTPMSPQEIARVVSAPRAQRAAERRATVLVPRLGAPARPPVWPYVLLTLSGFVSGLLVGLGIG